MEAASWRHRSLELEELVGYGGQFLDMVLLASGFQSNGERAVWNAENVERALGWAAFLEDAVEEVWEDEGSRRALDEGLANLMARTPHPPGMPKVSVAVLMEARIFLVHVFLQAMGVENGQIGSVVAAVAKVEGAEALSALEKAGTSNLRKRWLEEAALAQESGSGCRKKPRADPNFTKLWSSVLQETSDRCSAVNHVRCLLRALEAAAELTTPRLEIPLESSVWKSESFKDDRCTRHHAPSSPGAISCCYAQEDITKWSEKGLSYLLCAETMYKLSGALILFRGTKLQWTRVLDALRKTNDTETCFDDGNVEELAELCCLYLASERWKDMCCKLTAPSCRGCPLPTSTSRQFTHLSGVGLSRQPPISEEKRQEVEKYLEGLAEQKSNVWWNVAPILLAATVTPRSTLFNLYTEALRTFVDETCLKEYGAFYFVVTRTGRLWNEDCEIFW